MMDPRIDLIWFALLGCAFFFVTLKPDRAVRILSYGRSRAADLAPWKIRFLRVIAAIAAISSLGQVATDLRTLL